MKSPEKQIVFIIGAGFSRPFGLPLSSDLFKETLSFLEEEEQFAQDRAQIYKLQYLDNLKLIQDIFYGEGRALPLFEEFLSELNTYREIRKISVGTSLPGDAKGELIDRVYSQTVRLMTLMLDRHCRRVCRHDNRDLDKIVKMVKMAGISAKFISLNYDVILEKGIFTAQGGVNREGANRYSSCVFKPHGSIDLWKLLQPEKLLGAAQALQEYRENGDDIYRIKFFEAWASATDPGPYVDADGFPIIIPPSHFKDYQTPYFRDQVAKSVDALSSADRVYVIGCSFNPYDRHLRSMIKYAKALREPNIRDSWQWIVIDPSAIKIQTTLSDQLNILSIPVEKSWFEWIDEKDVHS